MRARVRVCDEIIDATARIGRMAKDERGRVKRPLLLGLGGVACRRLQRLEAAVEVQAIDAARLSEPKRRAEDGLEHTDRGAGGDAIPVRGGE